MAWSVYPPIDFETGPRKADGEGALPGLPDGLPSSLFGSGLSLELLSKVLPGAMLPSALSDPESEGRDRRLAEREYLLTINAQGCQGSSGSPGVGVGANITRLMPFPRGVTRSVQQHGPIYGYYPAATDISYSQNGQCHRMRLSPR